MRKKRKKKRMLPVRVFEKGERALQMGGGGTKRLGFPKAVRIIKDRGMFVSPEVGNCPTQSHRDDVWEDPINLNIFLESRKRKYTIGYL